MNAATIAFDASDHETAVSRAYYASYHAVIALVEVRVGRRRGWSHRLPEFARTTPELETLAQPLVDLYRLRVVADYESDLISLEQADAALALSRRIYSIARDLV